MSTEAQQYINNHNSQESIPRHLGLILDGNRRWAEDNGLPKLEGHRRGYQNLKTIAEAAFDQGVEYVSAFVFSTENWQRSHEEVAYLMDLLVRVVHKELMSLDKKGIRIRYLGTKDRLESRVLDVIMEAEEATKHNTRAQLALCFNYGGQTEISEAMISIMRAGFNPEDITPDLISKHLYAPDIPPVDFVIRTSGEQRLSNFMLWRVAYSEIYFEMNKHWPAYTADDLGIALSEYAARQRRFGK